MYPPERHVLRDLAISSECRADGRALASAPIQPFARGEGGGVRIGVIATVVDVAAASVAIADIHPDRIATVELAHQSVRPGREGPLLALASVLRRGSRQLVVGVDVMDACGAEDPERAESIGASLVVFRRLPARADHRRIAVAPAAPGRASMALPGSRLERPLLERVGLRVVEPAAGVVEIENHPYVRNSFGTLNGGMVALALEVAGEQAARAASGEPLAAADLAVHYLGQSGEGTLRTRARVLRAGREHAVCRVELWDGAAADRLLAVGTLTAARF